MKIRSTNLRHLAWLALLPLLWWALRQVPFADIWATLRTLSLAQLITLVAVNLGITWLFSSRWWLILRAQGHRVPYHALAGYRLAGFSVSYFTPGTQFGGEPLQVHLLHSQQGVPIASALTSVTLDKLFELLANFTLLAIGVFLILNMGLLGNAISWLALLWIVGLLSLPLIYLLALARGRRPLTGLLARFQAGRLSASWQQRLASSKLLPLVTSTEAQSAQLFSGRPWLVLGIIALSGLVWLLSIGEYWLSLNFLGARLDLFQAVSALTAARIAFLTPLPGGLGALEASQAFAMQALGFSAALGISASLLIRARDISLGLLGLWLGATQLRHPLNPSLSQASD